MLKCNTQRTTKSFQTPICESPKIFTNETECITIDEKWILLNFAEMHFFHKDGQFMKRHGREIVHCLDP